jgi:hypothetical protein
VKMSFALKVETVSSSETFMYVFKSTRRHVAENHIVGYLVRNKNRNSVLSFQKIQEIKVIHSSKNCI